MTLFDYLAAHATDADIQAIMAAHSSITRQQARYIHADAMLAAREQAE